MAPVNPLVRPREEHQRLRSLLFLGAAVVIIIAATALRIEFADYPLRYDEAHNYLHYSSRSPWQILSRYDAPNNHVLHTMMAHVSGRLLGHSPPSLRLPSMLAGIALVPLSGLLCWTLFRHRGASLLTMLAVASSSCFVEYAASSRGYSWMALFSVLTMITTVHLAEDPKPRRTWLLWGLLGALGTWTVPVVAPVFGCLAATLCARLAWKDNAATSRKRALVNLSLGVAIFAIGTAVMYAPAIWTTGLPAMIEAVRDGQSVHSAYLAEEGGMFVAAWHAFTRHMDPVSMTLAVIGFVGGMQFLLRKRPLRSTVAMGATGLLILVVLITDAPLTPPAWMVIVPLLMAVTAFGLFKTASLFAERETALTFRTVAIGLAVVLGGNTMWTISRTDYLSLWDGELYDVQTLLDEVEGFGPSRCALVLPYSPATAYYRMQRDLPESPAPMSPRTERVFLVDTRDRPMTSVWHDGVPGYEEFERPLVLRRLKRCTLYCADRKIARLARSDAAHAGDDAREESR